MENVLNEEYDLKEKIRINEIRIEGYFSDIRSMELFPDAHGTTDQVAAGIIKLEENSEKRREEIILYKNKLKTWKKSREVESKIAEIQTEEFLLNSDVLIDAFNQKHHLIEHNPVNILSERTKHIHNLKQELMKLHAEFNEMYNLYAEK
ncbi:hypothetical protein [Dyadobacter psychrotolerans]|uniref:Uncharacterized protein n=1 Tax=Dyadobacter psychrotolerans TaxID=2541721 RepID=A0A4R5DZT9_9BACT|nr:hypothetical protein [Dyadobacter psychrotolerans]TDE17731.1 hypothetical protein E0F88_07520 [Dyadobacter psychrotolerans]